MNLWHPGNLDLHVLQYWRLLSMIDPPQIIDILRSSSIQCVPKNIPHPDILSRISIVYQNQMNRHIKIFVNTRHTIVIIGILRKGLSGTLGSGLS